MIIFKKYLTIKQKVFKIFTLILALAAIVIACQKEFEDIVDNRDDGFFTVEQAKAWYEAKAPEYIELKSGKAGQKRIEAIPDWENADKAVDEEFEVVETPLNTKGSFVLVTEDTHQNWNSIKQQGIHASSIRLVVRYNSKFDVKESFLMTMVPDKEWLQKNPKRLKTSSYVNRPKGYSGLVLYHTLAGDFVNGWKYTDGKVTHTAVAAEEEEESKLILKSFTCSSYIVTGYFQDCVTSTWVSMGEYGQYTECGSVYSAYVGSYTICYYSGGSGGGISGGYEPNPGPGDPSAQLKSIARYIDMKDDDSMDELNYALDEYINKDCGTKAVYNSLVANGVKLDFKMKSSIAGGYAQYDPNNKSISFRSPSSIQEQYLEEEMFHAWQDEYYPGGTAQYAVLPDKTGTSNIEFEASFFKAVINGVRGNSYYDFGTSWQSLIIGIINEYEQTGNLITEFSQQQSAWYFEAMEVFKNTYSAYNKPTIPTLLPGASFNLFEEITGCGN